jgi:hypothetical protein
VGVERGPHDGGAGVGVAQIGGDARVGEAEAGDAVGVPAGEGEPGAALVEASGELASDPPRRADHDDAGVLQVPGHVSAVAAGVGVRR